MKGKRGDEARVILRFTKIEKKVCLHSPEMRNECIFFRFVLYAIDYGGSEILMSFFSFYAALSETFVDGINASMRSAI